MASIEKQKYRLLKSEKEYEIRHYPPAMMATIYSPAKSYRQISTPGFRALAGFIFGGNESGTRIAMTAPVHMDINDKESAMRFVMPSDYDEQSLPKPTDSRVKLEKSREEYVAVLKFPGYANDGKIARYSDKLRKALEKNGVAYSGNFRFLGYNPPYQFIGRRNEIIVSVSWPDK